MRSLRHAFILATAIMLLLPVFAQANETGSIKLVFTVSDDAKPAYTEAHAELVRLGQMSFEELEKRSFKPGSFETVFDGLATGSYGIVVYTGENKETIEASMPGAFIDFEVVQMETISDRTVRMQYREFQADEFKGTATYSGLVKGSDGSPRVGRDISAVVRTETAGLFVASEAKTDEKGAFELSGLAEGKQYVIRMGEDEMLGQIVAGRDKEGSFDLPMGVGDMVPAHSFKKLESQEDVSLADFKGKVVVVDFWATWCGPCQPAMAKMNTYRDSNPDWGDKVELIALSIDRTSEVVVDHINKNDWKKMYHAWGPNGVSKLPEALEVRGIPTVIVVNRAGEIIARGHPMALDIPAIVNEELAKGS